MTRRNPTLAVLLLAAFLALPRGGVGQTMSFGMHYRSVDTIDEMPDGLPIDQCGTWNIRERDIAKVSRPGSSFTQSLQRPGRSLTFYESTSWSQQRPEPQPLDSLAVEWKGKEARYLYIDLDGDGTLSRGERLKSGGKQSGETWFVTPTYMARTEEGAEWPVRYFLTVGSCGLGYSVASFWEGRCRAGGNTYVLRVSGTPPTEGGIPLSGNGFRLLVEKPYSWNMLKSAWRASRGKGMTGFRHEIEIGRYRYEGRGALHPLTREHNTGIGPTYYRCSVTTGTPPVVTITRDTRPLGDLELRIFPASADNPSGPPTLLVADGVSTCSASWFCGPENGVFYAMMIPEGRYRVRTPFLMRLTEDDEDSRPLLFWASETLPFEVKASTRTIVQIGYATGLHVGTQIDDQPISPGMDTPRSCRQGQSVEFHIFAVGKWGERFNYGEKGGTEPVPDAIRILAPNGAIVFEGPDRTAWNTADVPPGIYTIKATYPIPPLHTEMKDEISFEVKPAGPLAKGGVAP